MGARRIRKLGNGLALAALLTTTASTSSSQTGSPRPASDEDSRGSSLQARLSSTVAYRLFRSADINDRIRAVRRLGGQGDYGSVQLLLQAVDDTPALVSDARVRLEVVRAVAPFASRDPVRRLMVGWANDTSTRGRAAGPIGSLVREQAAYALAATSNARAVEQLVVAVMDGGPAGERASRALAAHPPHNLEPLLNKASLASAKVVELLGRLGDLRAIPKLRKLLTTGSLDVKVAAAVALARMGDATGVKVAKGWIKQEGSTHGLRVGATQTLVLARDPLAPRAIAILLADPATRSVGLSFAESAPTPQLSPTLAGLLTIVRGPERVRVLSALARAGGPLAIRAIGSLVRASPIDTDAAYALAHCRDPQASRAIAQLVASPATRRTGARTALVRHLEFGDDIDGLTDVLESMATSPDEADRAVGIFGLVVTGRTSVQNYVTSKDPVTVLSACRGALARPAHEMVVCARQLTARTRPVMRDGLAGTLLGADKVPGTSTNTLMRWAESARVSAPVFARALGSRDAQMFRKRVERLLSSGDPAVRSQVAIGLAESPQPSSATLLTRAYAFEAEPRVRRAIIRGLAARRSAVGRRCLERAARLDPDDQVRAISRRALAGRPAAGPSRGTQVLWLRLEGATPKASTARRPVGVVMSNGYATVAVTAADGQVLIPGVTPGELRVRVAAEITTRGSSNP